MRLFPSKQVLNVPQTCEIRAARCSHHLRCICAGLALLAMTAGARGADVAASEPAASQPAGTRPASQPARLDPAVERILDRLEKKGDTVKDIQADLVYIKEDVVLQDKQKFEGVLRFKEAQPNPVFFIRFDKSTHDDVVSGKKEWHVFDGQWYIEARESTQTINKHQVVRPGEKVEVFRLGQGPFPLPFGQKKDDIVRHFAVKLAAPQPGDPKNTDHLICTPLPGTDMERKYDTIHFYIDRDLDLPVKVSTVHKEEDQQIGATFRNLQINKGLPGSELNLPSLPDYAVKEDELPPAEEKEPPQRH